MLAPAAGHISRLLEGDSLGPSERAEAATFFLLQQRRTPRGRQWAVEMMEHVARLQAGIDIGTDEGRIQEFLQKEQGTVTDEEVAALQNDLMTAWREDRIVVEATSEHEVLGMFIAGNEVAEAIASETTWHVLRTDSPHEFVIADHPVCIFDALAPPDHGAGWLSSPAVEVTLPIGRQVCLMFKPGPPDVVERRANAAMVADLNLRSYASAEWAYFGSTQRVVQDVRTQARRQQHLVERYMPRKPHMFPVRENGRRASTPCATNVRTSGPTRAWFHPPAISGELTRS